MIKNSAMNMRRHLFLLTAAAWVASLAGCASAPTTQNPAVQTLAPTGKLRVGLYPGTPTSIIGDPSSGNAKGVGFDLGRELAQRAGVPFEPVVFARNAEVFAAAKAGSVDMVFTNATPVRRNDLDFSPTVLQVEQGYLVPAKSTIRTLGEIDRAGVRVGVSEGSTSETTLARELHNAVVVRTPSLKAAIDMLAAGTLEAFATNKATLFEMSADLPASRVLDGHWGLESFAIGIPKGREAALPFVSSFVGEAKASGAVARAIARAGLRGAVVPN
jgi:polar amino acid transport system substrate-binding protein